jgi:hypothetical protein
VEGTGTGKPQDAFTGILKKYTETNPVDDMVTWSAEFEISGAITTTRSRKPSDGADMDKATLLKGFLPEADVELPSGQGTVRVRGLSRNEAVSRAEARARTWALEVTACALGLLDPQLTEDEAGRGGDVAVAADVQAVARPSASCRAWTPTREKGLPRVRGGPGPRVRVFPGVQAGRHDRGRASRENESTRVRLLERFYARKYQREELAVKEAGL